jgi:hypothetical protein
MDETEKRTIHLLTTLVLILVATNIFLITSNNQPTTAVQTATANTPIENGPATDVPPPSEPPVRDTISFCEPKEEYACPQSTFDQMSCEASGCIYSEQEDKTPLCRPVECAFTNTLATCKDPCKWTVIQPPAPEGI